MIRINKRVFSKLFIVSLPVLVLLFQGCTKKESYKLAVLQWSDRVPAYCNAFDGFMDTLRVKGYVEGVNLKALRFSCNENRELAKKFAEKLVQWQPNIFLVLGTPAALEAKKVLQKERSKIPLIFTATTSPDRTGIIPSYLSPPKNMAGIGVEIPVVERVKVIIEAFPWAKKVGIVYFPDTRPAVITSQDFAKTLSSLGGEPELLSLNSAELEESLRKIDELAKKVDLLYFAPDPVLYSSPFLNKALHVAMKNKVPVVGITRDIAEKGAVLSEYVSYYEAGEEAADMAYKVLSGLSPDKLRSRPSNSRHIRVNLTVARKLNITIPRPVLLRADDIIDSPEGN